jgi:Flp pilus assembly protein TadG
MIEFLIVLIPLLIIMAGTFEFGWWITNRNVVENAAQAAVEQVAISGTTSNVVQTANAQIRAGGLNPSLATVTASIQGGGSCALTSPSGNNYQGLIATVVVSYKYQQLFSFLSTPMFGDIGDALNHTITATAKMPVSTEYAGGSC